MIDSFTSKRGLHARRGGAGERMLVLLHGMGANSSVWLPLMPLVARHWAGRWLAPDLRGHGGSLYEGPYGYGIHAADIATLLVEEDATDVTLLGHSFGGLIGALIGTGMFGVRPRRVAAVGVKIVWTEEERARARDIAQRPSRSFDSREEAIERYLKVSGLYGLMDPQSPEAAIGVRERDGKYQVAMDMRVVANSGASVEMLLKQCTAPLRLAAGAHDPMVSWEEMQRIDPAAVTIEGAGHNAHWEAPARVWQFFEQSE